MLKVIPIQSKDIQKELCEKCGIEYNQTSFAYRADDSDFIGISQFYFKDDFGFIENIAYAPNVTDTEAMIIMLRATMNFMFRCGIQKSYLLSAPEDVLKLSSYRKNENGVYEIDLKKFYSSPCHYCDK